MLIDATQKLEASKSEVIMVGDTAIDILAAKGAGIKSVGVTYGFLGPEISKLEPDFVIDSLGGLLQVLASCRTP